MSKASAARIFFPVPLTAAELEAGLQGLDGIDDRTFWERNVAAFRETVRAAIGETIAVLASDGIPKHWRTELQGQVDRLEQYIDLADRFVERNRRPPSLLQ